jgi:Protein of unknown function (DUF3048) N-terminal domain/Protein of unknown function (DUF3048) C-terminal domain
MARRHCTVIASLSAACVMVLLAGCGGARSTGSATTTSPGSHRCPLTDRAPPAGGVPGRPALAVKVDNAEAARPQYGLGAADVVYEEPVEGGLTRFIAIYQCQDSPRIEPIRSGRIIDPEIVEQYGAHPLFSYSGGIDAAVAAIRASRLIDVGAERAPAAYRRDPGRSAPHNLYSSTAALYAAGRDAHVPEVAPAPVFEFGPLPSGSSATARVHIAFASSPVTWTWEPASGVWARAYPTGSAAAAEGGRLTATNVIVMSVTVYPSSYVEDATGAHENLAVLTGSGPVEVLRDGVLVSGTWKRPALSDVTRYMDHAGRPIALAVGNTWVELVPTQVAVTSS